MARKTEKWGDSIFLHFSKISGIFFIILRFTCALYEQMFIYTLTANMYSVILFSSKRTNV